MNAHINTDGWLSLDRKGKRSDAYCPWTNESHTHPLHCGDWCPLFEELPPDENSSIKETLLCLHCSSDSLIHTIVSDERAKEEEEKK